jgi:hypothetical protein
MITYRKRESDSVMSVYLDNRKVGEIKEVRGGFQYTPKGSKLTSEVFPTLAGLKRSLEVPEADES